MVWNPLGHELLLLALLWQLVCSYWVRKRGQATKSLSAPQPKKPRPNTTDYLILRLRNYPQDTGTRPSKTLPVTGSPLARPRPGSSTTSKATHLRAMSDQHHEEY